MPWHRYSEHGLKHSIRKYVRGTTCEACLKDFWTRSRLFTHLTASSQKCNQFYCIVAFAMSDQELKEYEDEAEELTRYLRAKGRRRTYAEFPPVTVDGPLHIEAEKLGITHSMRERVKYAEKCS